MLDGDLERDDYDEFQFLQGHAEWAGLPWNGRPAVRRDSLEVDGHDISFVRWGEDEPELVLVHGAGQNVHTWDTFAMAVGRPAVAIDLPGHGRSSWREDRDYMPPRNAHALAAVVEAVAPDAACIVGMSLGGLSTLRLSGLRPELVRAAVIVDITPGVPRKEDDDTPRPPVPMQLMRGPREFESFEAILDATHQTMPHRTRESIVPGLRHNSRRFEDGKWGWRYDELWRESDPPRDMTVIWEDVANLKVPAMFVKGANSPIVSPEAVEELERRLPSARFEEIEGAGHAVQNDKPVELAALVNEFLASPSYLRS